MSQQSYAPLGDLHRPPAHAPQQQHVSIAMPVEGGGTYAQQPQQQQQYQSPQQHQSPQQQYVQQQPQAYGAGGVYPQMGAPAGYGQAMAQPVQYVPVAGPMVSVLVPDGRVVQSMPAHVSMLFKGTIGFALLLWAGIMIFSLVMLGTEFLFWWYYPFLFVLLCFLLWWKTPTRCVLSERGLRVYTRGTSYAINWQRVASIEVVRSACCWTGAACTFPRTGFTAMDNSMDCATSLGFTPADLNQFLIALQQIPGANAKLIYAA